MSVHFFKPSWKLLVNRFLWSNAGQNSPRDAAARQISNTEVGA